MKRVFDFILGVLLLLALTPLIITTGLVVFVFLGPPVIFSQTRSGKNARPFTMIKFMTMSDQRDDKGDLLDDELRLGRVGKALRSLSLDELPTLFNVVVGDMSFVGPRPLLPEYDSRYTPRQAKRLQVLPGITGLAQVNGRNAISWEEKFEYDVRYVENASFLQDLKILLMTLKKVLCREGVSSQDHVTMEKFYGTSGSDSSDR